jgi:hypothetical protein
MAMPIGVQFVIENGPYKSGTCTVLEFNAESNNYLVLIEAPDDQGDWYETIPACKMPQFILDTTKGE